MFLCLSFEFWLRLCKKFSAILSALNQKIFTSAHSKLKRNPSKNTFRNSRLSMKHTPKKVLLLGSGALKIGEAGEFDYSGSQKQELVPLFLGF